MLKRGFNRSPTMIKSPANRKKKSSVSSGSDFRNNLIGLKKKKKLKETGVGITDFDYECMCIQIQNRV